MLYSPKEAERGMYAWYDLGICKAASELQPEIVLDLHQPL